MASFFDYLFDTNKNKTASIEKTVEDKKDKFHQAKYILIKCHDGYDTLKKLLSHIKKTGNCGHSFSIVVDPEDEGETRFFWDGDGSDRIESITATEAGEDKELVGILLRALARIDHLTWIEGDKDTVSKEQLINALQNIQDLARPLVDGAEFDDFMKEALREIDFIIKAKDDSPEQKLKDIEYMVKGALKPS